MQCNELQRALRVLLELSNSREAPPEPMNQSAGLDVGLTLLALEQKQASLTEAVAGTARFATEFLAIIDAADATGGQIWGSLLQEEVSILSAVTVCIECCWSGRSVGRGLMVKALQSKGALRRCLSLRQFASSQSLKALPSTKYAAST
jgi:hypothetical protein